MELGWKECKHEPGVWIKEEKGVVVGILTVCVDDCMLSATDEKKAREEMRRVHEKHPVVEIKKEISADGTHKFDLLGADVEMNPEKRSLYIHMTNYAIKLLKKFDMASRNPARLKKLWTPQKTVEISVTE